MSQTRKTVKIIDVDKNKESTHSLNSSSRPIKMKMNPIKNIDIKDVDNIDKDSNENYDATSNRVAKK